MKDRKEVIKRRMIRTASKVWESGPQSVESFDPLVGLLMGAFAHELEKTHDELGDSENRIIEKLVEVLTPEAITSAFPSHAIASAFPNNINDALVGDDFQFFTEKLTNQVVNRKEIKKSVFFKPTGNYKLINGRVKYIVADDTFYEYEETNNQVKFELFRSELNTHLPTNSIWVGVEIGKDKVGKREAIPNHLSFFFNILEQSSNNDFVNKQLLNAQWSINNHKINSQSGIICSEAKKKDSIPDLMNSQINASSKVNDYVINYYQNEFVTIEIEKFDISSDDSIFVVPEIFESIFDENDIKNINNDYILWVKIKFPQIISPEFLEYLNISINCFPIINMRYNELTTLVTQSNNVIPMDTEEFFLDVKSAIDGDGERYSISQFSSSDNLKRGHAIIRRGGVERYDSRNAKQHIEHLLNLLKDESLAFKVVGNDMISSDLKNLNQAIARLEKKIDKIGGVNSESTYLFLIPKNTKDRVYVEYWSTDGFFGNNIKPGTSLQSYKSHNIDADRIKLVTVTVGGKDNPNDVDKINIYRKSLLSKGKLVTNADFQMLCYEHFGNDIDSVTVKKGIMNDSDVNNGIIRTIDLYIKLNNYKDLSKHEIMLYKKDLLIKLKQDSSNVFPFRVFLE